MIFSFFQQFHFYQISTDDFRLHHHRPLRIYAHQGNKQDGKKEKRGREEGGNGRSYNSDEGRAASD